MTQRNYWLDYERELIEIFDCADYFRDADILRLESAVAIKHRKFRRQPLQQSADYAIGPGDSLQIFVWDHQDLSTGVQVRPDGKISTPLVEDLQAAGRTSTELARDIENVLKEYIRTPVVTVIMQGFVGEGAQQIRVVGQAVSPSAIQYKQGMTVLDVMIQVGGLSEFAAGNKAKIVRKTADGEVEIRVKLERSAQ